MKFCLKMIRTVQTNKDILAHLLFNNTSVNLSCLIKESLILDASFW